jgi:hypothetical protein
LSDNIPRDPVQGPGEESAESENLAIRKQIGFGMDMEIFLRSDVGRYLTNRSLREIKEIHADLETVDPMDHKTIQSMQNQIQVRRQWAEWISVAIAEGEAAKSAAIERGTL